TCPSPRTTTHNQSGKWNRNGIKKSQSTCIPYDFLKWVNPKLMNMHFAKKYNKKDVKKMQANTTKAMSAHAEAIKTLAKSKEVEPKISKGVGSKIHRLAYTAHSQLGKRARAHTTKGLRLCWPKAKDQTKAQTAAPASVPVLSL
ncbi:hypothetical protein H8958_018040, partial [Nasalis larvatus]